MGTVEAIQANLIGLGVVLVPGSPENPPECIDYGRIYQLGLRIFEKANSNGPVFDYTYDPFRKLWVLDA